MAGNTTNSRVVIRINGREVEDNLRAVGKEIGKLKSELRSMNASDPEFKKKSKELQQLKQRYAEINSEINNSGKSMNGLKSIIGGFAGIMGVAFSLDMLAQWGQLMFTNTEKVRALKKELATMTGMSGSDLKSATIQVGALADTYDKDSKEVAEASNRLAKTFKEPFDDAFEVIREGFKNGADLGGDFLEQVKEYAPFIKEAGGEMKDLVNIIQQSTVDGVFNDKGIDAVKEGLLSIREMTQPTREALYALGIDADELTRKIESGQMSYWDAMQLVSKEMNNISDNSRAMGLVLADVWKGAGEDAGVDYLKSLHQISNQTKKLTAEQREAIAEQEKNYAINLKLNGAYEALTGTSSALHHAWLNIKEVFADVLGLMAGYKEIRLSDEIRDEQINVRMLQNELLQTNTTQARRNEIIKELQQLYPDIFKNLDLEKATNEELAGAIDKVNRSLEERYMLQSAQDDVEEAASLLGDLNKQQIQTENALRKIIAELQAEYKIELPAEIRAQDVEKQAIWLKNKINDDHWITFNSKINNLSAIVDNMGTLKRAANEANSELKETQDLLKSINETPEGARAGLIQTVDNFVEQIQRKYGGAGAEKAVNDPETLKKLEAEQKEAKKRAEQRAKEAAREAERRRKEAERAAEQERKRREAVLKELESAEENYRKRLLESTAKYEEDKIDLMVDGFAKEMKQIEFETEQKINAVWNEIEQLEKLEADYLKRADEERVKGNTKAVEKFLDLAYRQQNIIVYKNQTILNLEQKGLNERLKKIAEWNLKEVELRKKAAEDVVLAIETSYQNELSQFTDLQSAKQVLSQYYSEEDLKQITTLQEAREALEKAHNKRILDEKLDAFKKQLAQIQKLLNDDSFNAENGLERILTDEARDQLLDNLKMVEQGIAQVNAQITGNSTADAEEQQQRDAEARQHLMSGIDLLGYSADQWENAFANLNKAGSEIEKLAAAIDILEMALMTAMNAWSMLNEAENRALERSLREYEEFTERKKNALDKQLSEGYISQEEYNAKIEELDAALAAKQSETEYKKAMNEWQIGVAGIATQTALGIMKAVAASPLSGGLPWSAIVGGIGALQTAFAIKNKPKKEGYYKGGWTKASGERDEWGRPLADGPVHANEFVVANDWLKIPDVADAVGYIENRVNGNQPSQIQSEIPLMQSQNNSIPTELILRIAQVLENVDNTMTEFKENPPEAKIAQSWETTQRIKEMLDKEENIKRKTKV